MPFGAYAAELVLGLPSANDNPGWGNGQNALNLNASGQITQTLQAGEDETNTVQKVEGQFSYKICTADCQVKNAPGFVHTVTCATAAGVAVAAVGAITIRDALTETTPIVATIGIPGVTAFVPFTLTLDTVMTTGIYFAYDAAVTAGSVSCTISYR
jgi:hypothetical protein